MNKNDKSIDNDNKNIFQIIISFFKSIFKSSKNKIEYLPPPIENNNQSTESFINTFAQKRELLNLQLAFESGKVLEKDLTDEQKKSLISLYKEQIEVLKENIKNYTYKLEMCRNDIIKIKNNY